MLDINIALQVLGLVGTAFAIYVSLTVKAEVNEVKHEFEEKIGELKADIGYLKGRMDGFEHRIDTIASR